MVAIDTAGKLCYLTEAEEAVFIVCGYSESFDRLALRLARDV
tara:strand:- start:264370 stop:264495 length:126 start_codon:yes stop_codon:yes gene_type:complete